MKKIILFAFLVVFAWNAPVLSAKTVTAVSNESNNTHLTQADADKLVARLYEIRETAKNELNRDEKSILRKEVLSIRERLADPLGGGIYISAGALILIVILLIILL